VLINKNIIQQADAIEATQSFVKESNIFQLKLN